jgi:ABC-type sugar transport system ATPase subunit
MESTGGLNALLLKADGISKTFGGVRALSDVSLDVKSGEVHAICGENGAGKSTLIKILAGSCTPDTGRILIKNNPLPPGDIRASEKAGIHALYQESTAFPHLNAVENIFMGREPVRLGGLLLDKKMMLLETKKILDRLGEEIDQNRPAGQLPMAQRQMIGIARALLHKGRLLIMDEPTASLSGRETCVLFRIIRQLREEGVSILYISHRLEEIFEISDRATVLRDGKLVATKPTVEVTKSDLIRMMVGRDVSALSPSTTHPQEVHLPAAGKILLEVHSLTRKGSFRDISFSIRAGEILGLTGLIGAGRSEVAQTIFGITKPDKGSIHIEGKPLPPGSVKSAIKKGVALVPEDRQRLGLILPMTIGVNLTLAALRTLTRFGICSSVKEKNLISRVMKELDVRAPDASAAAETLSGGNQQKLVIGKWLASSPRVLLLDEPTRGVDVGAKAEIYQLIRRLSGQGMAALLISSDLPEILSMSDRILVMRGGEISGELSRGEASQEKILSLALPGEDARSNAVLTGFPG